jgi:hypothetical protein
MTTGESKPKPRIVSRRPSSAANPATADQARATPPAPKTPLQRWQAGINQLIETDLSKPRAFALLALVFYLVRMPFINEGYGTDPDAWRVVMTAQHLLDTGQYFPSRLPGNPLHELVTTLFVPGGWIAMCLVTATISLLGVYFFARILDHLNLPARGLMTICFAFTPLLYINSLATMDYMWTLTCLLGCYLAILKDRPVLAGVLLGCAIGFRLQSFAFGPSIAILLWRTGRIKELPSFCLAVGGAAVVAFSPVLVVYGISFFNFYDAPIPYRDVLQLLGKEALGILGGAGVLAGAALSLHRLRHLPHDAVKDPYVLSWVAVVVFYFISFLRLPHEIAYLMPVFPFGMILMAKYYTKPALIGAVICIVLAGTVDVTTHSAGARLSAIRNASIGKGLIFSNKETMDAQHAFVRQVMSDKVPDHSVVMIGYIFPEAVVRERDRLELRVLEKDYNAISMLSDRGEAYDPVHDIRYVWLLPYEAFTALRSQGYNFYVVPDAEGGTYALYKYRPTLYGASFLRLESSSAPATSSGTGSTDR